MKSKQFIENNLTKHKEKTVKYKPNLNLSQSTLNKTRSKLLKVVDCELNILKNNCPTKVNNKSLKEAEKEFNTFNTIVKLKTETYSGNCLLSPKNIEIDYQCNLHRKLEKEENSKKISDSVSMTKTNFYMRETSFNIANEYKEEVKKKIISFREVNYFKQKFLEESKNCSSVQYRIFNFSSERNLMIYVGTPNFNYKLEWNFENKNRNNNRKDFNNFNKSKMKKSLMYLQKLVFLLKNPLINRKIKTCNTNIEERKLSSEFIKKNRKIKNINSGNKFLSNSESRNKIIYLENAKLRSNSKKLTLNSIPPISKQCIEESKKYFFGN